MVIIRQAVLDLIDTMKTVEPQLAEDFQTKANTIKTEFDHEAIAFRKFLKSELQKVKAGNESGLSKVKEKSAFCKIFRTRLDELKQEFEQTQRKYEHLKKLNIKCLKKEERLELDHGFVYFCDEIR